MKYLSNSKNEIKITIIFECAEKFEFIYNIDDKLEKLINDFSLKKNIPKNSFYFLFNGKQLNENSRNCTFYQLMNNVQRQTENMNLIILAYRTEIESVQSNSINISLMINSENVIIMNGKKEEKFKDIIKRGISNNNNIININNFSCFYKNNPLDFNKKYTDLVDEKDKKYNGLIINAKEHIIVHFWLKDKITDMVCFEDDNLKDICNQFSSNNGLNIKNLIFKFRNSEIDLNSNKTIGQLYKGKKEDNLSHDTFIKKPKKNKNKEINIEVSEIVISISCLKKYTKFLFILAAILGVIIIAGIIIIIAIMLIKNKKNSNPSSPTNQDEQIDIIRNTVEYNIDNNDNNDNEGQCVIGEVEKCLSCTENNKKCKTCNIGYKLVNGKCKTDYFIKIVYFTKQKDDKIEIINDYSDIIYMFIEGKNITPINNNYQFKEEGNHEVFFQFKKINYYNYKLFENNKHIKSVIFSDFNEYQIGIRLYSMFAGCINLISVDFSKLSYVYESDTKYRLEAYGTQYMFDGCINLKYINIKNLKVFSRASYMFNNCESLTSIDLSNIDISMTYYFNNMFSNCISLQAINLKGFKLDIGENIQSMFNNCYSLKYLDISSFKPSHLTNMNSVFYNCSSLTSINFLDFYTDDVTDMGYLFYNCSSLKEINIMDFNTKNTNNMESMFEGCNTLTSIIIGSNFKISSNLKYINSMFAGCHSLTSININIIITNKITELSSLFSNCHSLTSINLKYFNTSNIYKFDYMFHNCYSLKNIELI